jgi:3-hydroxybutyryl-CoA dehydratase
MFSRTVTEADIAAFAGVSGDTNPIHLRDGFARTTRFGQRIAHGMAGGSFISTVIGTPSCGRARSISQTMNFMAPVIIGDTITAIATPPPSMRAAG